MIRPSTLTALALAVAVLAGLATPCAAQNVVLTNGLGIAGISIENATGATVRFDHFGNADLGANGTAGNVTLRDTDGTKTASILGGTGDLVLGGGTDDGDIIVRDTDGTTTTIHMQGEFGFIQLGSPDDDGDLRLWDNDPDDEFSINLDGATGNVTNQLAGNGLVKAWAIVYPNGTVLSCWRCDPTLTMRSDSGRYTVSFAPLGNLYGRPIVAMLDKRQEVSFSSGAELIWVQRNAVGPPPTFYDDVEVQTVRLVHTDLTSCLPTGAPPICPENIDNGFTIVVY